MIDLSRARLKPYDHQVVAVERLVSNRFLLLADEMGLGKTKSVIDAAHILHLQGKINKVLIVCPSNVKLVWYDPEFGELKKHHWKTVHSKVGLYGSYRDYWETNWNEDSSMFWMVTNYEYLRRHLSDREKKKREKAGKTLPKDTLLPLLEWADHQTLLVLDESSYVKSFEAKQTKACLALRGKVLRVVLMNGTPVTNSPMDLFTQGNLLHHSILNCKKKTHFMAQYATLRGTFSKPVDWPGLNVLRRLFKPHTLRRMKKNCLDLPPKLPSVVVPVPLENNTWEKYKSMRDELVVELESGDITIARQAVVKIIRLSQITSGLLGGFDDDSPARVISTEKKEAFLQWYGDALREHPKLKILVWSRFTREIDELYQALSLRFPDVRLGKLYGPQNLEERREAIKLLDPPTTPDEPVTVLGNPHSGKTGYNLAAAWMAIYISYDWSLLARMQSEDRIHRPGQNRAVGYFDFVATGPRGQATIDKTVLQSHKDKRDVAEWTSNYWVTALKKEKLDG